MEAEIASVPANQITVKETIQSIHFLELALIQVNNNLSGKGWGNKGGAVKPDSLATLEKAAAHLKECWVHFN